MAGSAARSRRRASSAMLRPASPSSALRDLGPRPSARTLLAGEVDPQPHGMRFEGSLVDERRALHEWVGLPPARDLPALLESLADPVQPQRVLDPVRVGLD